MFLFLFFLLFFYEYVGMIYVDVANRSHLYTCMLASLVGIDYEWICGCNV